jgi:hypothetical protein
MAEKEPSTATRDVLTLLPFFVVGAPMAYFIWHAFSDLLRGVVVALDLVVAVVLLVVFIFLARAFAGVIQRMAGREV